MGFFDKFTNTVSTASKEGISKAKEIKDAAKVQMDIKDRESSIAKMYRELGQAYYHAHKEDADPEYDQILAIKASFAEIADLKAELDKIKGVRRCPSCGQQIALNAKFCANCGTSCEEVPEKVDAEIVEEEINDDIAEDEFYDEPEEASADDAAEETIEE